MAKKNMVYLNGKFVDSKKASVSIFDHGLLYGDGVFEGIRAYEGIVFKLKEHMKRLYESAESIRLNISLSSKDMIKAVLATLKKNKLKDAYIRLIVTRGVGDLGLDPRKCKGKGSIIIIADKIILYPKTFYDNGLSIITAKTRRNSPTAIHPKVKSLNYLNNILGKIDAIDAGVNEAIMLTDDGYVAECTGDNLFIIKKGKLITPIASIGLLEGITRDTVMRIASKLGIQVIEKKFKLNEVYKADECFLTGTAAELIPVVKVDKKIINNGKPGPVTAVLLHYFRKATVREGVKIK